MRLYSSSNLYRIGLSSYAIKNLQVMPYYKTSYKADTYYVPTPEFEEMVKQHNVLAALKGEKKLCKPSYKRCFLCHKKQQLFWGS